MDTTRTWRQEAGAPARASAAALRRVRSLAEALPLGAAVRAIRTAKGLSARETAAAAGISRPHLDRIERGAGATLGGTSPTVERIAAALGVTASALVRQAEIEARRRVAASAEEIRKHT